MTEERIKELEKENKELKIWAEKIVTYLDQIQDLAHEEENECFAGEDVLHYAVRIVRKYHALKRWLG